MSGDRVAAAARDMLGVRFRLHGRGADGLDCVGLAAHALRAGGWSGTVPTGYPLRGGERAGIEAMLDAALARGDGSRPGDVLLVRPGPGQWHLLIRTEGGAVHADAGLACVVERPGALPWPLVAAWRIGRD